MRASRDATLQCGLRIDSRAGTCSAVRRGKAWLYKISCTCPRGGTPATNIPAALSTSDLAFFCLRPSRCFGVQVAGALHDQTKQMEKIVDDLAEIEFTMKKASQIIRDITKGLLTDK